MTHDLVTDTFPLDDERAERDAAQLRALRARLADANVRIAELERSEGDLRRRIHVVERDLIARLESAEAANGLHDMFPAYRMEQALRGLTLVQRRDLWLRALVAEGVSGPVMGLSPHDGGDDPLTILVVGSGGFGDMIYLSALVRGLFEQFPRVRIFVLHTHPDVRAVFGANPYIVDCLRLEDAPRRRFLEAAASLDVFDLIADLRYVVSYATPPRSRIPLEFALAAHARASEWQSLARRDWPHLNNLLGREAARRGLGQYELLAYTANLNISAAQAGDLFPREELDPAVEAQLAGRAYITLHHGADRHMAAQGGRQTKNLPLRTWEALVARCTEAGLLCVQLGEPHEVLIPGVALDLRGRCGFGETALLIKHARAHVDTEGGLVHAARAMGTRAVVAFGPTPKSFFGYSGNVNVPPQVCGDCWWTTPDWATACPRGEAEPSCMASHEATGLAAAAIELARADIVLRAHVANAQLGGGAADALAAFLEKDALADAAVMIGTLADAHLLARHVRMGHLGAVLVPAELLRHDALRRLGARLAPFTSQHVAYDTARLDRLFVTPDTGAEPRPAILREAARIVRPGGRIIWGLPDRQDAGAAWAALLCAHAAKAGDRVRMEAEPRPAAHVSSGCIEIDVSPPPEPQARKPDLRRFVTLGR